MDNATKNSKRFDLSQNSFVIFVFGYAPFMIIGTIVISYLHNFLPSILTKILYGLLFIGAIVKGIMDLQLNKRTLIVSDSDIVVYLKKRRNSILITKIQNDEISSIKQFENESFIISKKSGEEEIIPLSCALKPYNITLYSIKASLYKIFGDERTGFADDKLLIKYMKTKTMPQELLKADDESKIKRLLIIIIYSVLCALPTLLGIGVLILFILKIIIVLLKGLIAVLTPIAASK